MVFPGSRQFAAEVTSKVPLCVDLDGTLIRSDLLVESMLALLARNPLLLFAMGYWLLRGKAFLKQQVARRVTLDAATLPYNSELVEWLQQERGSRFTVLCTASDEALAHRVAAHLKLFNEVLASDGRANLAGRNKAAALAERFGERGFDYVGNSSADLAVWKQSRAAIVVETGEWLSKRARRFTVVERSFQMPRPTGKVWAKALRLHQWIKNVLIFLPLLAAHRLFDVGAVLHSALAFLSFGLCASSVYLTNDLLDLASDRQHHRKRHRPFAAGRLPIVHGPIMAMLLLAASICLAWALSHVFFLVLFVYYALTTAYSFRLKRVVMLDVVVLSLLYTSRILAGTAAIHSKPSFWLLAFSMFMFLSLAMVKRYTELRVMLRSGQGKAAGRGYDVDDIPLIQSLGASSGYLAVLVLALYIDSTASESLYRHPHYLWVLCPLLLYWISRMWAIAHRGIMHDDPVVFSVMDNVSRVIMVLAAIAIAVAI